MFLDLLFLPVTGPIGGLIWIGEKIQERADIEYDEAENLHKLLLSLQLSYDMGNISEEEFEIQEEELLLKIQALEEEEAAENESESSL
ncbi:MULTISPECIES: gas vesicle protein GvpG [unclassified Microcystis]|uniref:gas vesicle protein GvpG n=1 Tax=unclassified Microcystis TaxID=2643300 RepID=UPI0022C1C3E2|nr:MULTISPECIES: gas vesicle protein GvpG [unclassified Microcystis]MCA2693924.1 gas vesicle protein GvpG [Microcystis sp. M034S2]MCA2751076.1 gas vesicle protein GvpG [Microcystis sp. M144S2]MCZ8202426.1 gas vesicle protein GvpG [Microcystis sp. LE19-55.1A]MCZ8308927.1 gas vesicle protein GvpG [Microcystis sp. LE19-98.1E]